MGGAFFKMSATLTQLIEKFRKIDVKESVIEAFNKTEDTYTELNLIQMLHGKTRDGQPIGEYHSEVYAQAKNRYNPLPGFGVVDLRITGAFYGGVFARIQGQSIFMNSSDFKTPKLLNKYGERIFGLTEESKQKYINEFFQPALIEEMGL